MSLRSAGRPLACFIAMMSSMPAIATGMSFSSMTSADERSVETFQVVVVRGRDEVEILCCAAVAVYLHRYPSDDREVDPVPV